jgi:TIGR03009 family protein
MRMPSKLSRLLAGLSACFVLSSSLLAQQPAAPGQPPPQVPPQFQLNAIEEAFLDQVLEAWERESAKVVTFRCDFERWEYNPAFGPGPGIPLNKDKGELSYQKPDKGSFQITEIRKWQAEPTPPGAQPPAAVKGDWVTQAEAIGEHWVCDGKAIYEYREDQKQLVERPIPPEMQGKAIVDGPLPFLFGAEAKKLKARYWMRIEQAQQEQNPNIIWVQAMPKFRQQAADYTAVEVMLDRERLLPTHMKVYLPNQGSHLYMFDVANATVNGTLDRVKALFSRPKTPWGWQRVVEEPPTAPPNGPAALQAAQPGDVTR